MEKAEEKREEGTVLSAISEARKLSKQRKFQQTWDFCINLRGVNLKKPENRFSIDVPLPRGRGKEPRIAVFADTLAAEASELAAVVIRKEEIAGLKADRKRLSEVMGSDVILGEAPLMAMVGKELGPLLAPKGKMPKPVPPNIKMKPFVEAAKRSVRLGLKDNPVIHASVGTEGMKDDDVAANMQAVFGAVKDKLPKGLNNIRSTYIKLTMGKPVKVGMR